jgi:MFS family permease
MNANYKILLIASLVANFADNLIGSFYAIFVQKIGGDILDIGYTTAFYLIATGFLIIFVGKISDKINKELITIAGYLLGALGSLGYLFVSHPWQLFGLQIIFALGAACLSAPLSALFSKFIDKKQEGLQWALEGGGSKIVVGLSVLVGTALVKFFGFQTLFITMFILQLVATFVQAKLCRNKKIVGF